MFSSAQFCQFLKISYTERGSKGFILKNVKAKHFYIKKIKGCLSGQNSLATLDWYL